ncbi:MAG: paraquat-inducible protein A [Sulfurovum sp.]|nr:paraquat-inducible protein A [Sulfurovum sp.]
MNNENSWQKKILYSLLTLMLATMVFLGYNAYTQAKAYEKTTSALVSQMSAKKLAEFQLKELAETFSLGFYENDKKKNLEQLRILGEEHKKKSQKYTLYFILLLLGILGSYFLLSLRAFTFFGSLASLVTLVFGLITPIMMVTIHKEVEYLGDVVLSFESKGVIGSISKLFENGDAVVAIVILLFSVLIPTVKILSLLFVSVFMKSKFAHGIVKFFKMIGKWSMVDVFVVATFLVYLTVDKGDVSRAEVEVGLYFFLAYVIVSMLVSLSADRMLHRLKG